MNDLAYPTVSADRRRTRRTAPSISPARNDNPARASLVAHAKKPHHWRQDQHSWHFRRR